MHPTARAMLSEVISLLTRAGFKAAVLTGRNKRKGFGARYVGPGMGVIPAVYLHDYCEAGEFAWVCTTLTEAGYKLEDCTRERGADFVKFGCARVLKA